MPLTKIVLNATHLLITERFFDPELWEAHYLENFLEAISSEYVQKYNLKDMTMVLQILASLKKEAPWIFEKIDKRDLENLVDNFFNVYKAVQQKHIEKFHMSNRSKEKEGNFENQVVKLLSENR